MDNIAVDQTEIALSLIGMLDKYLFNANSGANYLVLRGMDGLILE